MLLKIAVAPGKTVVDSRTKVFQSVETVVMRRILVRDGQTLKRRSPLQQPTTEAMREWQSSNVCLLNVTSFETEYVDAD